ncbi:MAG: YihA family ribosome biogenesis GTP-binding protein [Candidatus Peribacteria bacterium]|nr:MAG: YihA family ribosome biogenesis GTP-binding protein [Candidatus Peribacteria bacterium]
MPIQSAKFIKSAYKPNQSPEERYPEIIITGRSNVGKSSLINALTGRKELAKVGKKPGKTTLINFFLIDEERYLVDFPGYGYAKKSKAQRSAWLDMMQDYLTRKNDIVDILVLINSHLPLQDTDQTFLELLVDAGLPFSIVLTKTDKVNQSALHHHTIALKAFVS